MNQIIKNKKELISSLPLSEHNIITIVGAGGKTTLLYTLAEELSKTGQKVLFTTTTHIARPSESSHPQWFLLEEENEDILYEGFCNHSVVGLGIPMNKSKTCNPTKSSIIKKWSSPSFSFLEKIHSIPDYIICEGDGSKRLPIKIPREKEPVLFPYTQMVLGVIGLSCLGQPLEQSLFGWQAPENQNYFHTLLATTQGINHKITADTLFEIATSFQGLLKSTEDIPIHVILNQADLLSEQMLAEIKLTAEKIRDNGINCHIVSLI